MESPIETLSYLLALYQMIKFALNLALAAIRYVRSKIGTRPPPKSGDKSGTDCPNAGITNINININNIYNYNICNEHCHPPCTHSGKTDRRRRVRSGRQRSARRR